MLSLLIPQACVLVLYTPSLRILVEHVMSVGTRTASYSHNFSSSFVCICVCKAMRLRCLENEKCESLPFLVDLPYLHVAGKVKVNITSIYPQTMGEF